MTRVREAALPGSHAPSSRAIRCPHCGGVSFYDDDDGRRCLACGTLVGTRRPRAPEDREPYAQLLIVLPAVLKATKAREAKAPTIRERRRLREQRVRIEAAIGVLTQEQDLDTPHCPKCDAEVKNHGRQCHSCASKGEGKRKPYKQRKDAKHTYYAHCIDCGIEKFRGNSPRCLSCGQKARRAREAGR